MVVEHTLGKTLVCFCFLHMENFGEKICRCIVHTGGYPVTPLGLPLSIQQKVGYPTLWSYLGYTLVLLGWFWYSFGIALVLHTGNEYTLVLLELPH